MIDKPQAPDARHCSPLANRQSFPSYRCVTCTRAAATRSRSVALTEQPIGVGDTTSAPLTGASRPGAYVAVGGTSERISESSHVTPRGRWRPEPNRLLKSVSARSLLSR
jgi:hypothetical protein